MAGPLDVDSEPWSDIAGEGFPHARLRSNLRSSDICRPWTWAYPPPNADASAVRMRRSPGSFCRQEPSSARETAFRIFNPSTEGLVGCTTCPESASTLWANKSVYIQVKKDGTGLPIFGCLSLRMEEDENDSSAWLVWEPDGDELIPVRIQNVI
jgi:hypothetical protein